MRRHVLVTLKLVPGIKYSNIYCIYRHDIVHSDNFAEASPSMHLIDTRGWRQPMFTGKSTLDFHSSFLKQVPSIEKHPRGHHMFHLDLTHLPAFSGLSSVTSYDTAYFHCVCNMGLVFHVHDTSVDNAEHTEL